MPRTDRCPACGRSAYRGRTAAGLVWVHDYSVPGCLEGFFTRVADAEAVRKIREEEGARLLRAAHP